MSVNDPDNQDVAGRGWQHPVLAYLLQFLMTFLGVSLGFFADNLREHWSERRTESEYLISLQADLIQDTAKLNFSIARKSDKLLRLDSLVRLLSGTDRQKHSGKIHFLLRYASIREPFYATTGTINQLESAGGLRIIQNRSLVAKLNEYQSACAKVAEIQAIRDDQSTQLKSAIARIADGRVLMAIQDFSRNSQGQYWLDLPEGETTLLSESPEEIRQLIYWLSNENSLEGILQQLHRDLKADASKLLAELDHEMGD